MLTVLGGLAEFERELIRARTSEGRARAKAAGKSLGRKPKLTAHQKQEAIGRRDRGEGVREIARHRRGMLYRWLAYCPQDRLGHSEKGRGQVEAKDVLSLSIATVALVASLVSIVLQYTITIDARFKLISANFVSLASPDNSKRQTAVALTLALYNLGNRPFALDSLALFVNAGSFKTLLGSPPTHCDGGGQFLSPISRATFGAVRGLVGIEGGIVSGC
jgi:hypothetical protein